MMIGSWCLLQRRAHLFDLRRMLALELFVELQRFGEPVEQRRRDQDADAPS